MNGINLVINQDKCKLSGSCIRVCPEQAISANDGKPFPLTVKNATRMAYALKPAPQVQSQQSNSMKKEDYDHDQTNPR